MLSEEGCVWPLFPELGRLPDSRSSTAWCETQETRLLNAKQELFHQIGRLRDQQVVMSVSMWEVAAEDVPAGRAKEAG